MKTIGNYAVRIVRQGDRYGLNDCLTHDRSGLDSLVEFYLVFDPEVDMKRHGPRGFFVSRYYAGTLLNAPGFYGRDHTNAGLCLHGDRYNYHSIDAAQFAEVLAYLNQELGN
jgi:hypothetical protein